MRYSPWLCVHHLLTLLCEFPPPIIRFADRASCTHGAIFALTRPANIKHGPPVLPPQRSMGPFLESLWSRCHALTKMTWPCSSFNGASAPSCPRARRPGRRTTSARAMSLLPSPLQGVRTRNTLVHLTVRAGLVHCCTHCCAPARMQCGHAHHAYTCRCSQSFVLSCFNDAERLFGQRLRHSPLAVNGIVVLPHAQRKPLHRGVCAKRKLCASRPWRLTQRRNLKQGPTQHPPRECICSPKGPLPPAHAPPGRRKSNSEALLDTRVSLCACRNT